ncbi:MAG: WYL domain-containing protein, partial [Clostridiales bacterium]|nr:WYL domain-containing protein [Clostridiales bacterium]
RWILQFGQGAKVLNPSHLKEKIIDELEKSLKQYKNS